MKENKGWKKERKANGMNTKSERKREWEDTTNCNEKEKEKEEGERFRVSARMKDGEKGGGGGKSDNKWQVNTAIERTKLDKGRMVFLFPHVCSSTQARWRHHLTQLHSTDDVLVLKRPARPVNGLS